MLTMLLLDIIYFFFNRRLQYGLGGLEMTLQTVRRNRTRSMREAHAVNGESISYAIICVIRSALLTDEWASHDGSYLSGKRTGEGRGMVMGSTIKICVHQLGSFVREREAYNAVGCFWFVQSSRV